MPVNNGDTASDDLAGIEAAADSAVSAVANLTENARIDQLEERIAAIEPLLEQLQASSAIGPKLQAYIDDLISEQSFFAKARYVFGALVVISIIGLFLLLLFAIFDYRSPLWQSPPLAIAAFIIGLVSSVAVLLSSFTKGVFRSANELHSDGGLPQSLIQGVELMNKLTGRN